MDRKDGVKLVSWDKYNSKAYEGSGDFIELGNKPYIVKDDWIERKASTITICVASEQNKIMIIDYLQKERKQEFRSDYCLWDDLDLIISRRNVLHVLKVRDILVGFCCHHTQNDMFNNDMFNIIAFKILPDYKGLGYAKLFLDFLEGISPNNKIEVNCPTDDINFWFMNGYTSIFKDFPCKMTKTLKGETIDSRIQEYKRSILTTVANIIK